MFKAKVQNVKSFRSQTLLMIYSVAYIQVIAFM